MAENAPLRLRYSNIMINVAVTFAKKTGLSPFNMIKVLGIFSFGNRSLPLYFYPGIFKLPTAEEFIPRVTQHIPAKAFRYYTWYFLNRSMGQRRKKGLLRPGGSKILARTAKR